MGLVDQWLFTKYDQFSRIAFSGIYAPSYGSTALTQSTKRSLEQLSVNSKASNNVKRTSVVGFSGNGLEVFYDNSAIETHPESIFQLLSVNYYDLYPPATPYPIGNEILGQPILLKSYDFSNRSTNALPLVQMTRNTQQNLWTRKYLFFDKEASKKQSKAEKFKHITNQ